MVLRYGMPGDSDLEEKTWPSNLPLAKMPALTALATLALGTQVRSLPRKRMLWAVSSGKSNSAKATGSVVFLSASAVS